MFTREKPTWGGRELALELNENHTKIYRILETLEMHGFLNKSSETKKYSLGFAVWELGNTLSENFHIKELIHPILERVSKNTNESVFLILLDGEEGLTFDAVESNSNIRFSVSIGSRAPLYAGASYRSILAHMPKDFINSYLERQLTSYTENTMVDSNTIRKDLEFITKNGYAISEGEYTKDVIAVAIPIFNKDRVIGSLTVSGPKYRIQDKQINLFLTELSDAKKELKLAMKN